MKLEVYTGYKIETQTYERKVYVNPNIIITVGNGTEFIPGEHDLNEFLNGSPDPFAHASEIPTDYVKLDQTIPQTIINGILTFNAGIIGYIKDFLGVLALNPIDRTLRDETGANVRFDWQNMKFPFFTQNGFLKTSGGNGQLVVDENTYLTESEIVDLIQQTPSTVIGNANKLYIDATSAFADNITLSPSPSTYPEVINTKATTSATSPVFLERAVSPPLGKTSIPGEIWKFNIYAACSNLTGLNKILFRINKRVIVNGIVGTWTGTGIIRTFTASNGTPFAGLTTTGNRISAPLIETPNQTGWVTVVNSSTQVTVNITDISYVNESNVSLNAIYYYLFQAETQDMDSITVKRYEVDSVQPEITGLNETDRLVLALFAYTDQTSSRNISLYYGGSTNYSNFEFPPDPLDLADLTNTGADPYAHVSELPKQLRITNASTTGSYAIDWNAADVWQLTLTGATTLTDSNLPTGTATKVIELVVKGAYSITLPSYWEATPSSGTYTGAKWNHIVVSCIIGTNGSEKVIYSLETLAT